MAGPRDTAQVQPLLSPHGCWAGQALQVGGRAQKGPCTRRTVCGVVLSVGPRGPSGCGAG